MCVEAELFAAGLPEAALCDAGHVVSRQIGPILRNNFLRAELPGALAGFQRTGQMGFCPLLLRVRGQLTAAQEDTARPRTLGSEDIFCLRGKHLRQKGIHDGDDIAQLIPAVQRLVPQHVEELVHVKDAAGLHDDPLKAPHGHGDELRPHPALVGVAVAAAADGLQLHALGLEVLQQHGVHVHRAEVVFQHTDFDVLPGPPCRVSAQESGLPCPEKSCDKVYLYHIPSLRRFLFPLSV